MLVRDRIYGTFDIKEPVLIELIHSAPVQRLKRIHQSGASQYLFSWKDVSRFEHSLGVLLLLHKFDAPVAEQIAGLLHDVPHTAFSHVIDFVYTNVQHNYHELYHDSIIQGSEIASILEKHEITQAAVDPKKHTLLEKDLPDLCADRIDYALRDFYSWKRDIESVHAKLAGITVHKNEFMFKNVHAAEAFAIDYLTMDEEIWAHPKEVASYELLAQAIRHALEHKILRHDDLFLTDQRVFQILKLQGDAYIQKKLNFLTPTFRIEPATPNHYHLYIKTKRRYVDPKVVINDNVKRLSELSAKFKVRLNKHLKTLDRGWYIFVYES